MTRTQKNAAGQDVETNTEKFGCHKPPAPAQKTTKAPAKSSDAPAKGDD